jgi:hypothetical protein
MKRKRNLFEENMDPKETSTERDDHSKSKG